jgi:NADP-dependent aldehyde dehydrogenase|tara:strand:+ start:2610 stop:4190 length:1581 start_codon:yes stop_codon:yes gene_type:complete
MMKITGDMIIGSKAIKGHGNSIHAINPKTGEQLNPAFGSGGQSEVDQACALAWSAFDIYRAIGLEARATFLETIADQIMGLGEILVERAIAESGLPRMRIEGERGRTVNQIRLFASVVRAGNWLDARIDKTLPERTPPRSDLRLSHVALGPVAVFGASNFPLAFSVAGGDTASALAAGCPVVVKAHSAHPGISELIGRAIQQAVADCGLPEGVFSMLYGSGIEVGTHLVAHPSIKAVGFTGSRNGGTALMKVAFNRPEPIPVYAEMSSINPVFLLPYALQQRGESIAKNFAGSLTIGAGQLCTSPGLVIAVDGPELDQFIATSKTELAKISAQTMLTPGIHKAYCNGANKLKNHPMVTKIASGSTGCGENQGKSGLYVTSAKDFLTHEELSVEVFGSTSLLVKCKTSVQMLEVAEHLEGQLTATLQMDESDVALARQLMPTLERKAGRIICNGYPTGVEVCHSMVHGGPFPSTSDCRTTSVGSASILRFLRPVCYQDLPESLLPQALHNSNPLQLRRLINGHDEVN